MYQAEINLLEKKVEKYSGVQNVMDKEDLQRDLKQEIREMKVEVH